LGVSAFASDLQLGYSKNIRTGVNYGSEGPENMRHFVNNGFVLDNWSGHVEDGLWDSEEGLLVLDDWSGCFDDGRREVDVDVLVLDGVAGQLDVGMWDVNNFFLALGELEAGSGKLDVRSGNVQNVGGQLDGKGTFQ